MPCIGCIPAPALKVELAMSGTLEGKETEVQVDFEFRIGLSRFSRIGFLKDKSSRRQHERAGKGNDGRKKRHYLAA